MPIAHAQLHELLISTIYQLVTEIGSKSVLQKEWVTGSISHYVFFVVCVQVFFILCSLTIWASNFSVYPRNFVKEWARSLVSTQPIRILSICCVYFMLIMKLYLCTSDQESALLLIGSKVLLCSVPCLDSVGLPNLQLTPNPY